MSTFEGQRRAASTGLRSLLAAFALCAALAAPASAAPANWLDPADLSKPGRNALNPAVVMDGAGNTVAIWERQNTFNSSYSLQISTRPTGGSFAAPVEFSPSSSTAQLAATPSGEIVAAWKHFENPPGLNLIQVATRPPGGAFSPPTTVYTAPPSVHPQDLELAVGPNGDVAVTWNEVDPNSGLNKVVCEVHPEFGPVYCPNPPFVMAAVRPAGGAFTAPKRISVARGAEIPGESPAEKEAREKIESKRSAFGARPAVDAAGNVVVAWSYFNDVENVIHSSVREVGKAFTAPVQISQPGEDAGFGDLDMDAAGNAIATWARSEGAAQMVQAALRPPGGSFSVLGNLSPAGGTADSPALDVSDAGTATVVWRLSGAAETFLQTVTRAPGGGFTKPLNISSGKDSPLFPDIASNDAGDTIVVWSGDNGANEITRAVVRAPGASFSAPVAISQASADLFHPKPTIDAGGNAVVVWVRDNALHDIVQWAGYDADPPELRDVSIPGLAKVGDMAQFSATSSDVWPVGAPGFDFGDGGQETGSPVYHSYSAPGTYAVRVTATDAAGRVASAAGTILVKARNFFKLGKLKKNRRRGTATLAVTIPEPGTLVASGKGIKKATVRSDKGATVKLPLKAAGKGLKRLNDKGRLKSKLKVVYSPVGGDPNSQQRRVALKKTLP